eukprot:CAMPEP_0194403186 /NCGR_PEP_ID=MMETSP0176-20130528/1826_1 /TAXON_ID=216777 /ORGANISM="Proboscia alata, Strain PI-D3" /LENGTH=93 /DNA_ID=CAMNT_0039200889 /DNA_START=634 /DNA_END=916 /DNA_ORIENTATION=+
MPTNKVGAGAMALMGGSHGGLGNRVLAVRPFYLLKSVMYTLKDAADRDRLSGSMFLQLNFVSTLAFAFLAALYATTLAGSQVMGAVSGSCRRS